MCSEFARVCVKNRRTASTWHRQSTLVFELADLFLCCNFLIYLVFVQCFFRTQGTRRRQWTPSCEEILCTTNRRPCYSRIYFMDGQYYSFEFQPSSTANDVIEIIKKTIGLQEKSQGYAIYEVLGNTERSLSSEEKV